MAISGNSLEMAEWLQEVTGIDYTKIRRCVIDISHSDAVTIYVEMYPGRNMLELEIPALMTDKSPNLSVVKINEKEEKQYE